MSSILKNSRYDSSITEPLNFEEFSEKTYFDDSKSTRTKIITEAYTSIIDSEPYRQGVEIRSIKGYSTGMIRMHSGYPGHRIGTQVIGQDDDLTLNKDLKFQDDPTYSPIHYIQSDPDSIVYVSVEGWSTYDHGQLKNVIEPLSIRPAITFMSNYFPYEAHSVWGNLEDGNLEADRSACQVLSIDEKTENHTTPFLDLYESCVGPERGLGIKINEKTKVEPFVDDLTLQQDVTKNITGPITTLTGRLKFEENSYVTMNQFSSNSGYQYDNCEIGTDSLAFGGMIYK
jgi:hypothetical protein